MDRRWTRVLLAVAAGVLTVLGVAACSGDGEAGADPASVRIDMLDNLYTRDVTRVPQGGTVKFDNDGDTVHNAVAADGS